MSDWAAKRFWKSVEINQARDGFAVTLDGKSVLTPAKAMLILPTAQYARMVAAEWETVSDKIDPNRMPVTRSANAAIDKVTHQKAEVAAMLADYGDSDLLCYRATEPTALVALQKEKWDRYLVWAADELGAQLQPRFGVIHQPQDPDALLVLSRRVHAMTVFELSAMHDLVSLSGSLILAFAATAGFTTTEDLWNSSRIDEFWQEQQWGVDEEAAAQSAQKRAAFLLAAQIFSACKLKY